MSERDSYLKLIADMDARIAKLVAEIVKRDMADLQRDHRVADLVEKLVKAEAERDQLKSWQENSADTAAALAHRACCGSEHDLANGKLHGYCVVCGVPWPCDTAKYFLRSPAPTSGEQSRKCAGTNCNAIDGVGHSKECQLEHDIASGHNAGNRNPEYRYKGYKNEPLPKSATYDQRNAWNEGRSAAQTEGGKP